MITIEKFIQLYFKEVTCLGGNPDAFKRISRRIQGSETIYTSSFNGTLRSDIPFTTYTKWVIEKLRDYDSDLEKRVNESLYHVRYKGRTIYDLYCDSREYHEHITPKKVTISCVICHPAFFTRKATDGDEDYVMNMEFEVTISLVRKTKDENGEVWETMRVVPRMIVETGIKMIDEDGEPYFSRF